MGSFHEAVRQQLPGGGGSNLEGPFLSAEESSEWLQVDVLFANAGFTPSGRGQRTAEGIETALGGMHLGHFALSRWLGESGALAPKPLVVAVSSDAMRLGVFERSLMKGAHMHAYMNDGHHPLSCTTSSALTAYAAVARARCHSTHSGVGCVVYVCQSRIH